MYQVLFNSLVYFQRYALDKLHIANIKKGSNSMNTVDRGLILAFDTFSDGPLSMYQVLFYSHVNFQRYAPNKLFTAKMKREVTPYILLTGS